MRIVLLILKILAAIILFAAWRASRARHADVAYHSRLAQTLIVSSHSFSSGGQMPDALTCQGRGQSPRVGWDRVPPGTRSFALVMDDWDAPTPRLPLNDFTHWVLYDIPAEETDIEEAVARSALPRQTPKVEAECLNGARSVLCGGRAAMRVPTAILCWANPYVLL